MARIVAAFDPGGTTGAAILLEDGSVVQEQYKELLQIWYLLEAQGPKLDLVVERFQFRYGGGRSRVDLSAVEVIGILKLYNQMYSWSEDAPKLYLQTPSQAKNLWTDSKLKHLGLWIPGKPHAMDATRHLLYHLVVTKGDRTWLEKLRPN